MKTAVNAPLIKNGSNLHSLYLSSRNWLSYIEFFEDEIKFFKKLMLKFFTSDLNDENTNRIQLIHSEIKHLERQKNQVLNDVFLHQSNIKATIEDMMQLSEWYLTIQHDRIQGEVKQLQPALDHIKAQLYLLTQKQIRIPRID